MNREIGRLSLNLKSEYCPYGYYPADTFEWEDFDMATTPRLDYGQCNV